MALIIIPTSITKSNYVQNTTLDGVEYVLRFRWNQRESKWYLAIELPDETVLVAGIKVVADWPLLKMQTSELLPPGELFAVDSTGQETDPGLRDLGERVTLFYFEGDSFD
jgi:hypothetical protein